MTDLVTAVKPFDKDFVPTVAAAVNQRERANAVVKEVVSSRDVREVFFVGCGGSLYAMYPVHFLVESTSPALDAFCLTGNEFNYRRPKVLGSHSLVIVASHSGRTKETLAAIETARERGASVLGVTQTRDSALAMSVDEVFTYGSAETGGVPMQILLANLGHALLQATGTPVDAALVAAAYDALPDALLQSLQDRDDQMRAIATHLQNEPVIYVLGAGPIEGVARSVAMCLLQEMQWMHAAAFNAGEFFHGAFEVVTDDVPVIVYAGEDATRPMADRAIDFLRRYTKKLFVVDSRDFSLPGVPQAARGEIVPIVLGSSVAWLGKHFEAVRGHDLEQRRYMSKVDY